MRRFVSLSLAMSLLLLAQQARADTFFEDAAAASKGKTGLKAGLSFGPDLQLTELRSEVLSFKAHADYGVSESFRIGGWGGLGFGGPVCIDYAPGPYPSDCILERYSGAGVVARLGLLRIAADGLQLGIEGGANLRWIKERTLPQASAGLEGAVALSGRIADVVAVFVRGGASWYYIADSVQGSSRLVPQARGGFEVGRNTRVVVEVGWARLSFPQIGGPGNYTKVKIAAGIGLARSL